MYPTVRVLRIDFDALKFSFCLYISVSIYTYIYSHVSIVFFSIYIGIYGYLLTFFFASFCCFFANICVEMSRFFASVVDGAERQAHFIWVNSSAESDLRIV